MSSQRLMCGNCSICFHFLLFPFLLPAPPANQRRRDVEPLILSSRWWYHLDSLHNSEKSYVIKASNRFISVFTFFNQGMHTVLCAKTCRWGVDEGFPKWYDQNNGYCGESRSLWCWPRESQHTGHGDLMCSGRRNCDRKFTQTLDTHPTIHITRMGFTEPGDFPLLQRLILAWPL